MKKNIFLHKKNLEKTVEGVGKELFQSTTNTVSEEIKG